MNKTKIGTSPEYNSTDQKNKQKIEKTLFYVEEFKKKSSNVRNIFLVIMLLSAAGFKMSWMLMPLSLLYYYIYSKKNKAYLFNAVKTVKLEKEDIDYLCDYFSKGWFSKTPFAAKIDQNIKKILQASWRESNVTKFNSYYN